MFKPNNEQIEAIEALSFGEVEDYYPEREALSRRDAWNESAGLWHDLVQCALSSPTKTQALIHLRVASRVEKEWGDDPLTRQVLDILGLSLKEEPWDYEEEGRKYFNSQTTTWFNMDWNSLPVAVKNCWCEVAYEREFGQPSGRI